MDMRKGSSETKALYQSNRLFRVNINYFFQSRGNVEHGPFPNIEMAQEMLSRFMLEKTHENTIVFEEENDSTDSIGRYWHDAVAASYGLLDNWYDQRSPLLQNNPNQ
jgi:hypothetical protein